MFSVEGLWEMFKETFTNDFFSPIMNLLKMNIQTDDMFEAAWGLAVDLNEQVVVPLAVGILLVYFLVYFIQKATSEQCTFEQLFLLFCKMIAAKYLIENGIELMGYLIDLGVYFVSDVMSASTYENPEVMEELKSVWISLNTGIEWPSNGINGTPKGDDGIFASIGRFSSWFKLLIPWLISIVLRFLIKFVCYARILEILLRTAMAPIAFADFFKEGTHGAGYRFLLAYVAVSIQGAFMAAIALLYSTMSAGIIGSWDGSYWNFVVAYFICAFACLSLLMKSGQLAKEIVGTQ